MSVYYGITRICSQVTLFPDGYRLENYTQFCHEAYARGGKGESSPSFLYRTRSEVNFHLEKEEVIQSHTTGLQYVNFIVLFS